MRGLIFGIALMLGVQTASAVDVPAALKDWQAWALDQQEYRQCPLQAHSPGEQASDYVCDWPGELQLMADATGASFSLEWRLYAQGWVSLPGDSEHWPQDVQINGQPAPVVEHDAAPALYLAAGSYQISGQFAWSRRPQSLIVPDAVALIRLQVDGQRIAPIQREADALVLGRGASEAPEADALDLRVFRRLSDALPALLETRLQLAVAGEPREIELGPVLPPGYVATEIDANVDWPVRLQPDGRLRIQAQPDYAEITLTARAVAPLAELAMPSIEAPWPVQEIWSYQSDSALRVSSISGQIQVDPSQSGVPAEWHELPSFALKAGDRLVVEQRSRGLGPEQGNRLTLSRQAWLDYDGDGWTFRDQINGQMLRDWRLDVLPPLQLDSAKSNADQQYLLVTRGEDQRSGVEWRTPSVNLLAALRLDQANWQWPVGGWNATFDRVDTTLNLPFGYKLLAAPGADQVSGSWVGSWDLLDLFIAALVALFAWRLLGIPGGLLALIFLLISHGERDAPLWSLAAALAIGLLLRNLPGGRISNLAKVCRGLILLSLVLIALPFAAEQMRLVLHPQLERADNYYPRQAERARGMAEVMPAPAPPPPPPPASMPVMPEEAVSLDRVEVSGSRLKKVAVEQVMQSYASTSVLQAGRGLPNWQGGRRYQLQWSGPILAEQDFRLWLSPPWLTRMLRLLAVLSLALLLWQLLGRPRMRAAAVAPLLLLGCLPWSPAQAQNTPDPALLQDLTKRLSRPAECAPDCVALAEVQLEAKQDHLRLRLKVHALTTSTLALPSDPLSVSIDRITLNGRALEQVRRIDEVPSLTMERGVQFVEVDYLIGADRVALAFPTLPYRVRAQLEDWQASGLNGDQLSTETLRLTRVRHSEGSAQSAPAQTFPPYVRVERSLNLGLDWTVSTRVQRIAPSEGGFSISLPLLTNERVQSKQFKVRDGRIEVAVADGQDEVFWESILDKTDALQLSAGDLASYAERWQVVVSPMWSASFSGLPESLGDGDRGADQWHVFGFDPLPAETLRIVVQRPEALPGETQAIDQVSLVSELGRRAIDHTLSFTLRATQGGERSIGLGDAVELLGVSRNGQSLGLRLEQGQLSLPVQPGEQRFEIRYRQTGEPAAYQTTPQVELGLPAANVQLLMQVPHDRWIWLTFGPRNGPAVLIWGELIVLVLLAAALARLRLTPLRFHHWLLLGLGFALFSWAALIAVAAWLLALGWRQRQGQQIGNRFLFDGLQLALLMLSAVAVIVLMVAISRGLLSQPDMGIAGNGSSAYRLQWFADQADGALPQGAIFSLPIWVYRSVMLLWALWLANALLAWLRWALQCYTAGGSWRRLRRPKVAIDEAAKADAGAGTPNMPRPE